MATTLLDGKWEFINHEIYHPQTNEWTPQKDFATGMMWHFCLSCAFENYEQGTIIESAPNVEDIEMKYIYTPTTQRLIVDVEIEDIYELTFGKGVGIYNSTIYLSALADKDNKAYIRYTLGRI